MTSPLARTENSLTPANESKDLLTSCRATLFKVLRLIPGLENADFVRLGQMHRNTFINAPVLLEPTMAFRQDFMPSEPYSRAFARTRTPREDPVYRGCLRGRQSPRGRRPSRDSSSAMRASARAMSALRFRPSR